jgi:hypothetical protein
MAKVMLNCQLTQRLGVIIQSVQGLDVNILRSFTICTLYRGEWVGLHVALMGEMRKVCIILVGKLEGKRPTGIVRHKWKLFLNKQGVMVWT